MNDSLRFYEGIEMSCYFIAQIRIRDKEKYRNYEEGFDEIFANYRGEVVAVDDSPSLLEGKWGYTRAVLIRFPNEVEARKWYESAEYQRLARHRYDASDGDVILVAGRD